jgi:hypothetical protein
MYAPALETAAPTVFMVWLQAWLREYVRNLLLKKEIVNVTLS